MNPTRNDTVVILKVRSGRYTWNRYATDETGDTYGEPIRAGGTWINEADCYDAAVEANPDHGGYALVFDDDAAVAEGGVGAKHVVPPVPGYSLGPGQWSTTDPTAQPNGPESL